MGNPVGSYACRQKTHKKIHLEQTKNKAAYSWESKSYIIQNSQIAKVKDARHATPRHATPRQLSRLALLSLILLISLFENAIAGTLFTASAPFTPGAPSQNIVRQRWAEMISPSAFSEPTATINLFDDATVSVTWLAHDPLVLGNGLMHRADPNSCNGCSLGIGVSGNQLNGFAYINGKQYSIETNNLTKTTRYLISELQNVLLDPRNTGNDAVTVQSAPAPLLPASGISPTIDVLMLVTPQLLASDPLVTELTTYVGILNNAFQINSVNKTVRVVGVRTVAANIDGMNASDAVLKMAYNGDGVMDEIHAERDLLGADLVALFANFTGGASGAAISTGYITAYNPFAGFSISEYSRPTGAIYAPEIFAHEVGHNLGAGHIYPSVSLVPSQGIFPYSCGHRLANLPAPGTPAARTIMTYPSYCEPSLPYPCDLVPSFSDPLVSHRGQPSGIANFADNGRTVRETADYVSNLRPDGGLAGKVELETYGGSTTLGARVGAFQQTKVNYQVRNIVGRATNVVMQFNFTDALNRRPYVYFIDPTPFTVAATNNSSIGNSSGLASPIGGVECNFAWIDTQATIYFDFIVEHSSAGRPSVTFNMFADQIDLNPANNTVVHDIILQYPLQN